MSDALVHAMAGDWIGETLARIADKRINNPFLAAVIAFSSHALLDRLDHDYTPDWVEWRQQADLFRQDLPYLAAQVTGLGATFLHILQEKDKQTLQNRLAGLIGSLAPDVIDGVYAYLNPEAWRDGRLLLPWHRSLGEKGPAMSREEALGRTAFLTLLRVTF